MEMIDFQNSNVAVELASLDFGIDFDDVNILDGLHTPSPSDSLYFGSPAGPEMQTEKDPAEDEPSITESGQSQNSQINNLNNEDSVAQLGTVAAPSPAKSPVTVEDLLAEAAAGNSQVQTTEPPSAGHSEQATIVAISDVPVVPLVDVSTENLQPRQPASPASLPSLNGTQSNRLLSLEGVSQGPVSSTPAQLDYPNLRPLRNEDLLMLQGTGRPNEYSPNNAFSIGFNHQPSSYPSLFQQNPAEGILNQRQFMSNQGPQMMCNSSWPQHHQFPAANYNVYDSQYAPNHMPYDTRDFHWPQQYFSTPPQQGSHVPGMQRIFDVQDGMHPVCPTCSRPELYSYRQSAFASMPPNPYDHQHVYRPMAPEPAVPSGPARYPDYHPQPRPFEMANNSFSSFSSGSSMPPRYPQSHDHQRNHYHSQTTMSNGVGQQGLGSALLSGPLRVSDKRNEYNQLWSTPSIQGQSSTARGLTMLSRFTGSNVLSSRVAEPSNHWTPDASNSSFLSSKAPEPSGLSRTKRAPGIQLQKAAPAATNTVTTLLDKGKRQVRYSPSRAQAGEELRKLLYKNANSTPTATSSGPRIKAHQTQPLNSQDPDTTWMRELEKELTRAWNQPDSLTECLQKEEPSRRRRRPPERLEIGEPSSPSKRPKLQTDSAGKERAETPPNSREADKTAENEENEDEDANDTDPSAERLPNSVYDPKFEKMGLPIDPHIRCFKGAEI